MIEKILLYVLLVFFSHFLLRIFLYFDKRKNKGEERVRNRDWILLSAFFGYFFFSIIRDYGGVGYEIPESDFETKNEYRREFYVNLFPNGSKDKNFRVPAKIFATWWDIIEEAPSIRAYEIEEATLPNGKLLTFYEWSENSLELDEKVFTVADDGSEWDIELTDKPAP